MSSLLLTLWLTSQRAQARFGGGGHFGGGFGGHTTGGIHGLPLTNRYGTLVLYFLVFGAFFAYTVLQWFLFRDSVRRIKLTAADYQQLRAIFIQLETTWSTNDLRPVQDLLTPEYYEKNQAILDDYARKGIYNRLTNIRLRRLRRLSQTETTLTMRVNAVLRDSFVSTTTGKRVDDVGAPVVTQWVRPTIFMEDWTFEKTATGFKLQSIHPWYEFKRPF